MIGDLELLDRAVFLVVDDEQVDDPHDVLLAQQTQLVERLALELGVLTETDDEDLHRSHCHVSLLLWSAESDRYMLCRILVFWKSNSAWVSTPWSSRLLSCVSLAMGSSSAAGAAAARPAAARLLLLLLVLQVGDLRVLVRFLLAALLALLAGVVRDAADDGGAEQWPSPHTHAGPPSL